MQDLNMDELLSHRRMRRNRKTDWLRRMVAETLVTPADLIWAVFVAEGKGLRQPVLDPDSGIYLMSPDILAEAAKEAADLGIPAIAVFPRIPMELRTEGADNILQPDNVMNEAVFALKSAAPHVGIITDTALDPFTSHGQDGIFANGVIDNDLTVDVMCRAAVLQAEAGADIVAPSDMMDGRVAAIRRALDRAGHQQVNVMSYATKFASNLYTPYRDTIKTGGLLKGDKSAYYLSPANGNESIRDAPLDVGEGADMLIVKPGLPYLDICWRLKQEFKLPVYAYQVLGEYAQIRTAGLAGYLDEELVSLEYLTSFKRAGADGVHV